MGYLPLTIGIVCGLHSGAVFYIGPGELAEYSASFPVINFCRFLSGVEVTEMHPLPVVPDPYSVLAALAMNALESGFLA
jgi:hypothetical protein